MLSKTIVVLATAVALSSGCAADALAAGGGGGNWSGGGGGYGGPAYGGGGPPGAQFYKDGGGDQGATWQGDSRHHRAIGTFGPWGSDCRTSTYYGHPGSDQCEY